MPSLGSHLARAHELAERVAMPEIDAARGPYYFGSTAPDVRIVSRLDRRVTHFYELDDYETQDSVARMFEEHPGLSETTTLGEAVTAFIAGYITHLVLDQCYIEGIYREFFGLRSPLHDDSSRNAIDRALQYELDRIDREDRDAMLGVQAAVSEATPVAGIPFIDDGHLVRWHDVVIDVAGQEPDYSRFHRMLHRHLAQAGMSQEEVDEQCSDPQALIRRAFDCLPDGRIDQFWEESADLMRDRVREYLR
jgi:hypothetical protein